TGRDRTELASASWVCAKPHVNLATPVKLKQPAPNLAAGAVLSHEAALPGAGPTRHPERGLLDAVVNAVIGSDSAMRERLRLMMAAILGYASWIATIGVYAIPYGVISPGMGQFLMGYVALMAVVFYALIRSGYSTRWQDQQIILPQLISGCMACVACYWVAPALRPIVLQSMCVLLIFGMVTLKPRAALLVGGLFTALLLATMGLQYRLPHPGVDLTMDALKVALSCFIFLHLSTLSFSYSKLRQSVASEQTRLAQAVQQVHELLIHDALTGLFNRKYLVELLERERQRFTRSHSHFCVALIDLDHFKRINDSHGHHVGDEVLIEFGRMARSVLRETDVIGRWGGEEFLVVMPDTEPGPNGIVTLERLHQRFATHRIQSCPELRVAFSSGVAEFRVDESLDQTMERADRALYAAKAGGRNRCVLAP
ncbi:MAG: GGDEF domain-containing protein, partial [Pseudomonadota bacterium]